MKQLKLNNGLEIPSIGYGTWKIKPVEEISNTIKLAIESGYRLIDTAAAYQNEKEIGEGIKNSKIERKELFISGKVWNEDRGYEKTIEACKRTIENLGCEYLDLYLIHWPASKAVHENWKEINIDTWKAMEYLYENGYVKAIGVCNFKVEHLEDLIKNCKIIPMVNQIEYHPGFIQEEIVEYCKNNNIIVEAWSPLGSGKMMKNKDLIELAEKYKVSVANLCINWCYANNIIPLPKSSNADRMKENLNVDNIKITKKDMEIISKTEAWKSGLDADELTIFG